MIKLCSGLIVPRRKGFPSVNSNDRTLVERDEHDLWIVRVDPDAVVIITAGCAAESAPGLSAINRFPGNHVGAVYYVFVFRIGFDLCKITSPAPISSIAGKHVPTLAGIIAAVHAAVPARIYGCIHSFAVARRNAESDPAQPLFRCWQTFGEFGPGVTSIS